MRRLLGMAATALGVFGATACAAAITLGWWVAARTTDRVTLVAGRLHHGLAEADARLERVEARLAAVRAALAEARGEADKLAAENPELPRVRAAIERLLDRLLPTIKRAAALADSLRAVGAGLRAAEALNVPQERIDAVRAAAAVRLARELLELALVAAAGSERLAEGLAGARREVAVARARVAEGRDPVVSWVRAAAVAHTLVWLWAGLGQLCLIGWGRRRTAGPVPGTTDPSLIRPE